MVIRAARTQATTVPQTMALSPVFLFTAVLLALKLHDGFARKTGAR